MRGLVKTAVGVCLAIGLSGALHATTEGRQAAAAPGTRSGSAAPGAATPANLSRPVQDVVGKYCVSCHSERLKTADLVLEGIAAADVAQHADVWEKVVHKLRVAAMPPAGSPRPDAATYKAAIAGIEQALDRGETAAPGKGRTPIARLNRLQYTNAIRDLFGLEIDGEAMLPRDDAGFGFDNIADLLKMSPALLDRYLIASNKISRLVVSDPTLKPAQQTYLIPRTLGQDQRMSEELPFGSRGGAAISHLFPTDGEYVLRIIPNRAGANRASAVDVRLDRRLIQRVTIGGGRARPPTDDDAANYQPPRQTDLRIPVKAGEHVVSVSFQDDSYEVEGVGVSRMPRSSSYGGGFGGGSNGKAEPGLGELHIIGPFGGKTGTDSPMYGRVFSCVPATAAQEEPCARKILTTLAGRAYRRQATAPEVATLVDFYRKGRADASTSLGASGNFQAGIEMALSRMLMDTNFLFRVEHESRAVRLGVAYPVSDLELASRLSFFLWSSIPDDTLLDLAERGTLRNPGVLEQQVRRMVNDPRAETLASTFFAEWFGIQSLAIARPDPKIFPDFDENLRAAFQQETRLFLQAQLRDDRPAVELLTANYSFLNERLAQFYGIPGVSGSHFRRVSLAEGPRIGLLGQGSLLTTTSYPDRTSVVLRGKWILSNLLSVPPPPPPPNVPRLDAVEVKGSLRQRMEIHRQNPVCASCHRMIDPLGFALENFDGIGKYRERDGGAAVDSSGVFLDGGKFSGAPSLRTVLVNYQDAFLSTAVEKMMTYALGRGIETSDMPAVRRIIKDSAPRDHRWSSIILGIVSSQSFQMRRSAS